MFVSLHPPHSQTNGEHFVQERPKLSHLPPSSSCINQSVDISVSPIQSTCPIVLYNTSSSVVNRHKVLIITSCSGQQIFEYEWGNVILQHYDLSPGAIHIHADTSTTALFVSFVSQSVPTSGVSFYTPAPDRDFLKWISISARVLAAHNFAGI